MSNTPPPSPLRLTWVQPVEDKANRVTDSTMIVPSCRGEGAGKKGAGVG